MDDRWSRICVKNRTLDVYDDDLVDLLLPFSNRLPYLKVWFKRNTSNSIIESGNNSWSSGSIIINNSSSSQLLFLRGAWHLHWSLHICSHSNRQKRAANIEKVNRSWLGPETQTFHFPSYRWSRIYSWFPSHDYFCEEIISGTLFV